MDLIVSEFFGPTLQGEGRSCGRPAFFLRLGMCNLDCKWCDTPYTWDWSGKNGIAYDKRALIHMTSEDVVKRLDAFSLLVITGGEPLIQQKAIARLLEDLPDDISVEIETNGTLHADDLPEWVRFNVSPKLPHSGVDFKKAIDLDVLRSFRDRIADFKFVVASEADAAIIADLQEILDLDGDRIFIMPEGRSAAVILEQLPLYFLMCAEHGWNLSPRLHVLAFDDQRGI
jgi:7-carboxy-7-deazaguanine synthase